MYVRKLLIVNSNNLHAVSFFFAKIQLFLINIVDCDKKSLNLPRYWIIKPYYLQKNNIN